MKKIFLSIIIFFFCSNIIFAAAPINRIIFIGDSLTDNGRLFSFLLYQVPKSPPYFKGRFTNGYTWAEFLAKHYYEKNYMAYKFYAIGASTAVSHLPTNKFLFASTLGLQVDSYLIDTMFRDKSKTLPIIWIGSNDYLYYQFKDSDTFTSEIVDAIVDNVRSLLKHGINYLVLMNLPDSSLTPFCDKYGDRAKLHELVLMHNDKLNTGIEKLKQEFPKAKIELIDVYNIFLDFIAHVDEYNAKYNMHVKELRQSCWKGGYINDHFLGRVNIYKELQMSLAKNAKALQPTYGNDLSQVDVESIANFIQNSPEVNYVYKMGLAFNQGLVPCSNPNEYLFWDSMHPTETVHHLLYELVREQLDKEIFS